MTIVIKRVTQENKEEILQLKVKETQRDCIETIAECLAEVNEEPAWRPVGIYEDQTPIGFAMYGLIEQENRVWFDRFLIAKEHQGKGYAKVCVELLVKTIDEEYGNRPIYLSVYDYNHRAIAIYEHIGFKFNGEEDSKGEKVMVLSNPSDNE